VRGEGIVQKMFDICVGLVFFGFFRIPKPETAIFLEKSLPGLLQKTGDTVSSFQIIYVFLNVGQSERYLYLIYANRLADYVSV